MSPLRQYFERDDGSLPEIELAFSDVDASVAVFRLLFSISHFDPATVQCTAWSLQDNADVPFPGEGAASQVVAGFIEPFHVLLPGLCVGGGVIPDLGVFFSSGSIVIDYRMGADWTPQAIQDFMQVLARCIAFGGVLSVPWWGPAAEAEFHSAIAVPVEEGESANPFDGIPPVDESSLHCCIGEELVAKVGAQTDEGDEIQVGAVYKVVKRKGSGWDLDLVKGCGASRVRVLNSRVLHYFRKHVQGAP